MVRSWATLIVAAVLVASAACGGSGDGDLPPDPQASLTTATPDATAQITGPPGPGEGRTPPPAVGRPGDFTIPESRLDDILAAASEFERPLLADGVLTFAEYEQAVFAGLSCLEEKGATIVHVVPVVFGGTVHGDFAQAKPGPRLTARGQYFYIPSLPGLSLPETQSIRESCAKQYHSIIDFLWAEAIAPTESERQTMTTVMGDCMRERGLEIPENPSEDDLLRAAWPPDGVQGPQHTAPNGGPVASALALFDCRIVTRFDMGFE